MVGFSGFFAHGSALLPGGTRHGSRL